MKNQLIENKNIPSRIIEDILIFPSVLSLSQQIRPHTQTVSGEGTPTGWISVIHSRSQIAFFKKEKRKKKEDFYLYHLLIYFYYECFIQNILTDNI